MEMMCKEVQDDITTLYKASLSGCTTTLEVLMDRNPRLLNKISLYSWNETPLHIAAASHIEITQALLQANDDACLIPDQDGMLPLHHAARKGRVEVVRALISARPDSITQAVLHGGDTILHLCVKDNRLEVLKMFVRYVSDKGEFLNFKDQDGNTILHLAVELKQIEVCYSLFLLDF